MQRSLLAGVLACLLPACHDASPPLVDDASPPRLDASSFDAAFDAPAPAPDAAVDAGVPGEYVPLVTAGWSLAPGEEGYICASKTLTEDLYIGAIRPIAPIGTHHTTVNLADPTGPDDPGSPCGVSFGQFYASGVGTEELVLPDGVGLVAPAGKQLRLNLHLFNASDVTLSGTSGVEVKLVPAASVQHAAHVSLNGPFSFSIPSNGQPYSVTDSEGLTSGQTLIAIFPHMHQLGTHFRARVLRGNAPITLWDDDYQFESQEFSLVTPLVVEPGDQLETTCTWLNTTGQTVTWGDSSKAEMCFSILMAY
jgi:hypothetical protein